MPCTKKRLRSLAGDFCIRWLLRFEYQLPHPILCTTLATDKKWPFKSFPYLLPKLRNELTKNGRNFSKWSDLKIDFFKMSITINVPLNWYSSIKIFFRKIRIFFLHRKLTLKIRNQHFWSADFQVSVRDMKITKGSFLISGQSWN